MAILNARNVGADQPCALLDITLRELFSSRNIRNRSPIIIVIKDLQVVPSH